MKKEGEKKIDIFNLSIPELFRKYSPILYEEIAKLFNFIFEYKNKDEYENVNGDWIQENISIRLLKEIVLALAEQNNIREILEKNVLPFFQTLYRKQLIKVMSAEEKKET